MARTINKLNPLKVRQIAKRGLHADGNGLYLSVSKSGSKSWSYVFYKDKKRVELGLGPIHAVSLAQARDKARDANELRAQGLDPRRKAEPKAETFGSVALTLISDREGGWKNEKHRRQWRNTLQTYAAAIWDKAPDEITVDDVKAILQPIWTTKAETASRVRGRIEAVLDVAKVRGLRSGENPAAWRGNLALMLPKPRKGPKRHHPAMRFADVPAFMLKLRDRPGNAARALELVIHTAARTSEVLDAKWTEFDLQERIWAVPAERMKASKLHRVPLTEPIVALLKGLPRTSDYVFPSADPEKPLSNMAMAMLLQRMCLRDRYTVHGFRSSFRDWAGDMTSFPREVAEHALAHQVGSDVERAYRRSDALEQRRLMMAQWSAYLTPTKQLE